MMTITDESNVNEKFIEDVLVENLWIIEEGLELVKRQRTVSVGFIDILAKDKDENLVVIEIKNDTAGNTAFAQVMSYMAALAEELKISRKKLKGVIFCKDATRRVKLASNFVEGLRCIEFNNYNRFNDNQTEIMCLTWEETRIINYIRDKDWESAFYEITEAQRQQRRIETLAEKFNTSEELL